MKFAMRHSVYQCVDKNRRISAGPTRLQLLQTQIKQVPYTRRMPQLSAYDFCFKMFFDHILFCKKTGLSVSIRIEVENEQEQRTVRLSVLSTSVKE